MRMLIFFLWATLSRKRVSQFNSYPRLPEAIWILHALIHDFMYFIRTRLVKDLESRNFEWCFSTFYVMPPVTRRISDVFPVFHSSKELDGSGKSKLGKSITVTRQTCGQSRVKRSADRSMFFGEGREWEREREREKRLTTPRPDYFPVRYISGPPDASGHYLTGKTYRVPQEWSDRSSFHFSSLEL